jgi:hypothetical protein
LILLVLGRFIHLNFVTKQTKRKRGQPYSDKRRESRGVVS